MERNEMYMAYLNGDTSITLPEPITRKDYYLAFMCGGYKGDLPTPITREDIYLNELCKNPTGGGSMFKGIMCNVTVLSGIYIQPTT